MQNILASSDCASVNTALALVQNDASYNVCIITIR